eukprot:TRINITY_DN2604_c0_g2_i1.p1 TRINITY_DN2604_c0_g2~~TRINITY_DN2604_c0_g2_i1.p1  ORF type:complete len:218 (-),score=1.50 TRINITY_DN2604_c0_g2_i1:70-723(-)
MWLFGKRKTPKELLREHQRSLRKAVREIDRERLELERQEKKVVVEIRAMAKKGQMGACKIMAKDLVRTRNQISKMFQMRSQLQAVSLRLQTLKSTATMADAMKGAAKAMFSMNKSMNLPAMQKIMMEFARQGEMMDMKQEMMDDTIDGVMEEEGDEEHEEEVINQVLDEIGIGLSAELADAPTGGATAKVAAPKKATMEVSEADLDLQARLDSLKKS